MEQRLCKKSYWGQMGLVGYEDGGLLTNAINENPHCVLFLDEIEKTDRVVYNTFLQVLDYGTLMDTKGNNVDFSNTIIIDRMDFLSSLQQASIFVDERTKGVKLVFRDDKLSIFSHSERGRAETQLEVTKQEKELEIAFNIHYLISILEKLTTTKINMVIPGGENKSCLLSATDDESYQYIVMPMRI